MNDIDMIAVNEKLSADGFERCKRIQAALLAAKEFLRASDLLTPEHMEENFHRDDLYDDEELAREALRVKLKEIGLS